MSSLITVLIEQIGTRPCKMTDASSVIMSTETEALTYGTGLLMLGKDQIKVNVHQMLTMSDEHTLRIKFKTGPNAQEICNFRYDCLLKCLHLFKGSHKRWLQPCILLPPLHQTSGARLPQTVWNIWQIFGSCHLVSVLKIIRTHTIKTVQFSRQASMAEATFRASTSAQEPRLRHQPSFNQFISSTFHDWYNWKAVIPWTFQQSLLVDVDHGNVTLISALPAC